MWKPIVFALCGVAVVACSPTTAPVRSSPERIIYDYHWSGQIEALTVDAGRWCGRFGKEARLERQDLRTLEYTCN